MELSVEHNGSSISPVHLVIWAPHLWSVYTDSLYPDISTMQTGPVQLRTQGLGEFGSLRLSAVSLGQLIEEVLLQSTILHHRVIIQKHLFCDLAPTILSIFVFSLSFSDTKGKETF